MKKVIVLCGDGLNCEAETAQAFEKVGAQSSIVHINQLLGDSHILSEADIFAIPGGFSFGDELGSGRLLAQKIIHSDLGKRFNDFVSSGRPILGICNGFQVLMALGVFEEDRTLALAPNIQGHFYDQWVELEVCSQLGPWLHGLQGQILAPMRHGEGRIVSDVNPDLRLEQLFENSQIAFRYTKDVNGSLGRIAGLVNKKGNVLGMMPHPEAAMDQLMRPQGLENGLWQMGEVLFHNVIKNIQEI